MIADNTVLILGAGASMPYGFPSGYALTKQIIMFMRHDNEGFLDICTSLDFEIDEGIRLGGVFEETRLYSIDRYLRIIRHKPEHVRLLKAVMAYILFQHEDYNPDVQPIGGATNPSSDSIYGPGYYNGPIDDWYTYLWDRLQEEKIEDFERNELTVLTFNYDRSLSEFLHERVVWTYGVDDDRARISLRKAVSIIHLHGSIGIHPCQRVRADDYHSLIGYGDIPKFDKILAAVNQIETIHESSSTRALRNKIIEAILPAKQIVFLGLSYQTENLERLLITGNEGPHSCWNGGDGKKKVCGTNYKMPYGDISATAKIFHQAQTGLSSIGMYGIEDNLSCIEFLKESGVLRGEHVVTPWVNWASRRRNS